MIYYKHVEKYFAISYYSLRNNYSSHVWLIKTTSTTCQSLASYPGPTGGWGLGTRLGWVVLIIMKSLTSRDNLQRVIISSYSKSMPTMCEPLPLSLEGTDLYKE